jgi:hypothetical protein
LPPPSPAEAASRGAEDSALVWKVKESLLAYVNRSGGRIAIVRPAYPGPTGFAFPHVQTTGQAAGAVSPSAVPSRIEFGGGIALSAHGGVLDILLVEPALVFTDGQAFLHLHQEERAEAGHRASAARLRALPEASTGETVAFAPLLTDAGLAMFGRVYPPGTELDPLHVPRQLLEAMPKVLPTRREQR